MSTPAGRWALSCCARRPGPRRRLPHPPGGRHGRGAREPAATGRQPGPVRPGPGAGVQHRGRGRPGRAGVRSAIDRFARNSGRTASTTKITKGPGAAYGRPYGPAWATKPQPSGTFRRRAFPPYGTLYSRQRGRKRPERCGGTRSLWPPDPGGRQRPIRAPHTGPHGRTVWRAVNVGNALAAWIIRSGCLWPRALNAPPGRQVAPVCGRMPRNLIRPRREVNPC